jgi:2-haloacid dehalogenase
VFGTLISVRDGSYAAFRSILNDTGARDLDVRAFWEYWEHRNIAHYWEPYRSYREICTTSLAEAFEHYGLRGEPRLIERYFDAFARFELYPDVEPVLSSLSRSARIAVVSNIDNDLLAQTRLPKTIGLACTAEKARGYKPDGTLFRYLIANAGVALSDILHAGQSQRTDLVGGKPLGLTIAWINRRGVPLDDDVPRPDYTLGDLSSLLRMLGR